MTQKVQGAMLLGAGYQQFSVGAVAAGNSASFDPLLRSNHTMVIHEVRWYAGTVPVSAPTISFSVGVFGDSYTTVNLSGGNTPNILTTLEVTTPSDSDNDSDDTQYIALNEGVRVTIDNSSGATDLENLIVEIAYREVSY